MLKKIRKERIFYSLPPTVKRTYKNPIQIRVLRQTDRNITLNKQKTTENESKNMSGSQCTSMIPQQLQLFCTEATAPEGSSK